MLEYLSVLVSCQIAKVQLDALPSKSKGMNRTMVEHASSHDDEFIA